MMDIPKLICLTKLLHRENLGPGSISALEHTERGMNRS